MVKHNWRKLYTHGLPKTKLLLASLEKRLRTQSADLMDGLENPEYFIGYFVSYFMSFRVDHCPLEICSRIFDVFLLDGEVGLIKLLTNMIDKKKAKLMNKKGDLAELLDYLKVDLFTECLSRYPVAVFIE